MDIGFALIPNDQFLEKLIKFQAEIHKRYNIEPCLSMEKNLPHITILQGNFPDSLNYDELAHLLCDPLKQENKSLSFSNIILKGLGWFFLLCQKEQWLNALHHRACDLLQGHMMITEEIQSVDDLNYLTPLEKYHHMTYGYRYMREAYLPHITLGRYTAEDKQDTLLYCQQLWKDNSLLSPQNIKRLTVYSMGVNGAHAKTLWEQNI